MEPQRFYFQGKGLATEIFRKFRDQNGSGGTGATDKEMEKPKADRKAHLK